MELDPAIAYKIAIGELYLTGFQSGDNGSKLKCRPRFNGFTERIIVYFFIFTVCRIISQVCNCPDFTGLDFHQDGTTLESLILFEMPGKGRFCKILDIDINSCYDVFTIPGFNFRIVTHRDPFPLADPPL